MSVLQMDREKKRRSGRKLKLSLTQNGGSSEESHSDADSVFQKRSPPASKTPKGPESSSSKQETFKSPVKAEERTFQSLLKDFCPICQVPLTHIKIPAEIHTAHCLISPEALPRKSFSK